MKRFAPLLIAAGVVLAAGDVRAQEILSLEVGAPKVVETKEPISRIVIDKPGVVAARLNDRRHLELTGVDAGETGLRLVLTGRGGDESYTVKVSKSGEVAAKALQDLIQAQPGLDGVKVAAAGGGFLLTGEVKDVETHARLSSLAKAQAGQVPTTDMVTVSGGQMVAVDIRFYAVDANTMRDLGFNFSALGNDIQGGVFSPSALQTFNFDKTGLQLTAATPLQNAFNLLLANPKNGAIGVMSALSSAGLSQILAQPTLLVRSGESADFLAGGDVPIPVPQGGGASGAVGIQYRPYGVRLAVAPIVLSDRRILLKLSPEVSELDYTNKVEIQGSSVPGFRRRSAATTVELGDGQSFVIAGLTYMTGSSNESRLPGLGDLPVLGPLFRTSQATHERQELIVVATPRLVSPLDHDPLPAVRPDAGTENVADWVLDRRTAGGDLEQLGLSK